MAAEVKALSNRVSQATTEIATEIGHLRQDAARSTESLARVRDEIATVQDTAGDILRVSGAHRAAASQITDGSAKSAPPWARRRSTSTLCGRRRTRPWLIRRSLGGTSRQLRDQGLTLDTATRALAGTVR